MFEHTSKNIFPKTKIHLQLKKALSKKDRGNKNKLYKKFN